MLPREIKRARQARGSAAVRFVACRHMERTAHDDELDLVHAVPESLELVHAPARLQVRVVSSADGPHGRRLVPVRTRRSERASDIAKLFVRGMPIGGTRCTCVTRTHAPRVGLRRVLKVRVGPAGAVHAHVARRRDVRTAVRLAHDGDDGDAGSGTHLPRAERARARASECKRVTTQRPGGVRTGFVSSSGARRARCDSGSAAMISISFGIFDVLSRRATCATRRGRDTSAAAERKRIRPRTSERSFATSMCSPASAARTSCSAISCEARCVACASSAALRRTSPAFVRWDMSATST